MRQATRNELERVRRLFDGAGGGSPKVIIMRGGIPDILHAQVGQRRRVDALPHETAEMFVDRMIDLANELDEEFVVVSGGSLVGGPRGFEDGGEGSGAADPSNR